MPTKEKSKNFAIASHFIFSYVMKKDWEEEFGMFIPCLVSDERLALHNFLNQMMRYFFRETLTWNSCFSSCSYSFGKLIKNNKVAKMNVKSQNCLPAIEINRCVYLLRIKFQRCYFIFLSIKIYDDNDLVCLRNRPICLWVNTIAGSGMCNWKAECPRFRLKSL